MNPHWRLIECANGPHKLDTSRSTQRRLRRVNGRWICHGCLTLGGLIADNKEGSK